MAYKGILPAASKFAEVSYANSNPYKEQTLWCLSNFLVKKHKSRGCEKNICCKALIRKTFLEKTPPQTGGVKREREKQSMNTGPVRFTVVNAFCKKL